MPEPPKKNISILHCTTSYPTKYDDVNLNVISTLKKKFKVKIGYSDHTLGIEVPIAAVSLGAEIIEKHVTLNNNFKGPDHKTSLTIKDFKKMVIAIRNTELALGTHKKSILKSEKENILTSRKSIVASNKILKGEKFSEKNLAVKRPSLGISPEKVEKHCWEKSQKKF